MDINIFKVSAKRMIKDSSVVPSDRMRSNDQKLKHEKFHLNVKKNFFPKREQSPGAATHGDCGASLSGDIPNAPGPVPVSPALDDPALAGGLDWMISGGPFQP